MPGETLDHLYRVSAKALVDEGNLDWWRWRRREAFCLIGAIDDMGSLADLQQHLVGAEDR